MYNGERTAKRASSITGAGKWGKYMSKNEIRTLLNTIHKNQFKTDLRPNGRPETIKFLEENIGRTLFEIYHSKIFVDPPPRVTEI